MLCLNALALGCGPADGGVTTGPPASLPEWVGVVSNATWAVHDPAGSVAFVSLPTGTLGIGVRATIRNVRTNAEGAATLVNGGFDPVRIAARAGDSLRVQIHESGGQARLFSAVVPQAVRPVIVRTDPTHVSAFGVPTRSTISVVFSEPMRANGGVRLMRGDVPVSGDAVLVGDDKLTLVFTPRAPLEYGTAYDFEIDDNTVDLDDESLTSPFRLALSTRDRAVPPGLTVKFQVVEYPDGSGWVYAPQLLVAVDATGGDAFLSRAQIFIPGIGPLGACWLGERVGPGTTREMFGESYGDWMLAYYFADRASGTTATATITYSDGNGDPGSLFVRGFIVPGGLPTTYGAGGPPVAPC